MAKKSACIFYILSILPHIHAQADPATLGASIKSDAGYSLLPGCINQCIWDIGDNDTPKIGGDLAAHLSCSSPWVNGCYCRGESASYAYSFMTSCFSYLCSTPAAKDINSGISVYTSYCSKALGAKYTPNATPESAVADVSQSAATASVTTGTAGQTSISANPTSTTSSNRNESSGEDQKIAGLSRGAFIGVVVSCSCSVIGLLFGIAFKVYKHKKQHKLEKQKVQMQAIQVTPKV